MVGEQTQTRLDRLEGNPAVLVELIPGAVPAHSLTERRMFLVIVSLKSVKYRYYPSTPGLEESDTQPWKVVEDSRVDEAHQPELLLEGMDNNVDGSSLIGSESIRTCLR
jgi:hypothetical protein